MRRLQIRQVTLALLGSTLAVIADSLGPYLGQLKRKGCRNSTGIVFLPKYKMDTDSLKIPQHYQVSFCATIAIIDLLSSGVSHFHSCFLCMLSCWGWFRAWYVAVLLAQLHRNSSHRGCGEKHEGGQSRERCFDGNIHLSNPS